MLRLRNKNTHAEEEEIDVTSFMSLMIILVPVLLISMTLAKLTSLQINLPEATGGFESSTDAQSPLEVRLTKTGYEIDFSDGRYSEVLPLIKTEDERESQHDNQGLSQYLQSIKNRVPDKTDILIKVHKGADYQSVVGVIETAKSYKTVVAASLVDVELFPNVSLDEI